jgi:transcriptional regulator with XRE-family HTH domain
MGELMEGAMRKEFRYGKRIQELRREREWTQEQLAEVTGFDARTVQRVERDQTRNAETLQAIAGAFDVDLATLRITVRIPESRLLRTRFVTTHREFIAAEEAFHAHACTRGILAPLNDGCRDEIEDLVEQAFADHELISPSEPELWREYVRYAREPLNSLFDMGFAFFLLDERRDLLLGSAPGLPKPEANFIDDWRILHYLLVGRHGCFQQETTEPLHRFDSGCREAGEALWRRYGNNAGMFVYFNVLYAIIRAGDEHAVPWCETCFPLFENGARVSSEYLEQITGMTKQKLHAIYEGMNETQFLQGLS